jgi:exfoliative toxin A/B
MLRLKKYPTPISGLTLGLAGICAFWSAIVSNTLAGEVILVAAAVLILVLLAPLVVKMIVFPELLMDDLNNPTVGSVVPTLAMTLMLISATLDIFSVTAGSVLWLFAVVLHVAFFLIFVIGRIKNPNINLLVPSWFVPPIGIVVACLTLPDMRFLLLAKILLFFGLIAYAIMLPVVLYRLSVGGLIEDARKPTLAILAAPASLTLAGYLTLEISPDPLLVTTLLGIAVLMTVSVYIMLLKLLKLPFSPAFSAFTFPLAISATALFKMSLWAEQTPLFMTYAKYLFAASLAEGVIASAVIVYVLQHYIRFLMVQFKADKQANV